MVSFNILHGVRADGSGEIDVPRLIEAVAALGPDLLALQEVDVGVPRSRRVDQARVVADALGLDVVFGKASRVGIIGRYGNALLVRGLMVGTEVVRLPRIGRSERRSAILATARIDGVAEFAVAATHLGIHRPEVHRQLDDVVRRLAVRAGGGPMVLLGDLNLEASEVAPTVEAAGLVLADTKASTYPNRSPRARIDHVAVGGGVAINAVSVVATDSSDHRALVVELTLP